MATPLTINPPYLDKDAICEDALFDMFKQESKSDIIDRVTQFTVSPSPPLRDTDKNIRFKIEPCQDFLWTCETLLETEISLLKADGTPVPPASAATAEAAAYASAGFINNISNSIIRTMEVRLNDTLISEMSPYYSEISYLLTILGYDKAVLKTKKELAGFYIDSNPGTLDLLTTTSGFYTRSLLTQNGQRYRTLTPLFSPFFAQGRALIPMCTLDIQLFLHPVEYCVKSAVTNGAFQYKVHNARLLCKKIRTTSDFQLSLEKRLQSSNARYPLDNFLMKSYIINEHTPQYVCQDLFQSSFLPNRAYVCISKNITPAYGTSPFDFQPESVSDIFLTLNGEKCPSIPFDLNYAGGQIARAYASHFASQWDDSSLMFDMNMMKNHYSIYCFSLFQPPDCLYNTRTKALASCQLTIHFSNAQNPTLRVFILSLSTEVLEITHNRTVIKNY